MHRILVLFVSCLLLPIMAAGQAPPRIAIRAGKACRFAVSVAERQILPDIEACRAFALWTGSCGNCRDHTGGKIFFTYPPGDSRQTALRRRWSEHIAGDPVHR
jgi:hypothetical protein